MSSEAAEAEQERRHFRKILSAFRHYRRHSLQQIAEKLADYNSLPAEHRQLLGDSVTEHLKRVRVAIEHNYEIVKLIVSDAEHVFENDKTFETDSRPQEAVQLAGGCGDAVGDSLVTSNDMDKVRSTLKQFARDWSRDGESERDACYRPVLDELRRLFPSGGVDGRQPAEVRVLVPGAGLGRLAWEIAKMGYCCQGNEWSLYMLLSSYFVINKCTDSNCFTLYPWAHQFCNNWSWRHQLRPVRFPDVKPGDLPRSLGNFSMAAGDFLEVYTEPNAWHCVATVFFIDTAHNVVAYLESLYKILVPGGYWINLGPLLYHFADVKGERSVELDYETLRRLAERIGFKFINERRDLRSGYTQNPDSMLEYVYNCVYFVAQKPKEEGEEEEA